ncbi:hypothetical protein COHA_000985 [Chlorella ohadii]|uniref:DNA mismatch repair proteins mutS family domain-containing protein n=1 Tax=Chlorella ohadii TaxID=2649997 RepID=A0AAD5H8M3_9CHLO|nr:hypothetical protein COHA_000985 [Chlorella ohadii]
MGESKARAVAEAETDWASFEEDHLGPAAKATLQLLEWGRLCSQVAAFAQTTLGQRATAALLPLPSQGAAERALQETAAVDVLESQFAADLDFGGIQTAQAGQALARASRGGLLSGAGLQAVASLLLGAAKLQRAIKVAAREAESTGYQGLAPVTSAFKDIATLPELAGAIGSTIEESGSVRESASEEVRRARGRVRTIEGRLRGILKGHHGEITEQSGRLCVAVPASPDGPPKGILLGSGPGGSTWYVEPPAAVPLNNELAAARGELYGAEETVLWRLTGEISDARYALQDTLDKVVWLDCAAARARYGRWVGGTLPTLCPFPKTGRARGGSRAAAQQAEQAQQAQQAQQEGGEEQDDADRHWVYLRRLRHPLLLGDHLAAKEQAERESRRTPASAVLRRRAAAEGSAMGAASSGAAASEAGPALPPDPQPIDVTVRPQTRAVIITGPNTGGKTASLKALGLAALAARCGLPVPAAAPAKLPCFDAVLADIGDEQSLNASLSTFSGHLRRIGALRAESGSRSLVLLDEVGTGTDPSEGSALGIALLRALVRGGPGGAGLTVASTHHGALTALKYEDERFENASVEFDEAALAPTYRLLWGIPGRSNALNIAQRLGLDRAVVDAARAKLGDAAAQVNATIGELEALRRRSESDEEAADAAHKSAAAAAGQGRRLRLQIAELEAAQQLQRAEAVSSAASAALTELKMLERSQRAAEAETAAAAEAAAAAKRDAALAASGWLPAVGETVFVPKLGKRFKVASVNAASGQLQLQAGKLKLKATVDEVRAE